MSSSKQAKSDKPAARNSFPNAKGVCFASEANEIFFGVVGHVGSGTGFVAKKLKSLIDTRGYEVEVVKASDAIRVWVEKNNMQNDLPEKQGRPEIWKTEKMQTLGDHMRSSSKDYAAVAQGVISLVRTQRAKWNGVPLENGIAVEPNPKIKRAYIIESIRHPAEVSLFRLVYGSAFALVGVVCHEDTRQRRLLEKYFERENRKASESLSKVQDLMDRDSDDKVNKFGQHVADAFWESDYFIDNTRDESDAQEFTLNEDLGRFIDIITHSRIIRPTVAETGMHIAVSAQIRSSCLSRQVGAAILDREGNVLAIGSNEVPKAGGGVYGENDDEEFDRRCFACEKPHCSSNVEQNGLIQKLLDTFPKLREEGDETEILKKIRKIGFGALLEFTRAIHAEMDALTSAARKGIPVKGATLFVTAFPCHYCARHIVAAGVDQVQYIEPYPKSRALTLHADSITSLSDGWCSPSSIGEEGANDSQERNTNTENKDSRTVGNPKFGLDNNKRKVLFKPFIGVAPRLYQTAFTKDRSLKDDVTGDMILGSPDWGGKWGVRAIPYTSLEASLTAEEAG
jgi:deoxycytidylate deaminase